VPFPLPLTPFERYYLADDRPECPTTFPIEFRFVGRLEREPFEQALARTLARHPMLAARIEDGPDGPRWVAGDTSAAVVDWNDESVPIEPPGGEYIDLRQQPGVRLWVRRSADATRVLVQIHHACSDGLAMYQWMGDLLVLYARSVDKTQADISLPDYDIERLRDRAVVDLTGASKPSVFGLVRDASMTAWIWCRILVRRCAVLAAPARSPGEAAPGPFLGFETHALTRDETDRLVRVAAENRVTINDLLIRDALIATRQWNRQQGDRSSGKIRVNVPVYVRGRVGADIPASNGIAFAFVALDPDRFSDRRTLLAAVHVQMEHIKRWKLGLFFLGGLAIAQRYQRLMHWVLRRERSLATIVLSNMGRAFAHSPLPRDNGRLVCGNVVLDQVRGAPPIRPLTRGALLVDEYAGQWSISLRCDPRYFSAGDTRALLDAFVRQVRQTAAEARS
jgi:hypothetical protein